MSRVGILGGTFDPPHIAHVAMARAAVDRIPLDKVLFMPATHPPHKRANELTPYAVRKAMVELAISGQKSLELSREEEHAEGPSYTVEMLRRYRRNSDDDLYLILGADSVVDLPNWRETASILEMTTLVVFPRTGYPLAVPVDGDVSVVLFEDPVIDVSSSQIRESYRSGEPKPGLLAESVHHFILDNSLYS